MYKILEKKTLNANTKQMLIDAPHVAKKAQPGQFIILRVSEDGERIPLTIASYDREKGTIMIIFQEVGATTKNWVSSKLATACTTLLARSVAPANWKA